MSIETIKAFYADVLHEKAGIGLVATTSTVAPGGKKIINSRGYNLNIAESNEIKAMVYDMWRKFY